MEISVDFSRTSISACQKFLTLKRMPVKKHLINDYIIDKQECLFYWQIRILTI